MSDGAVPKERADLVASGFSCLSCLPPEQNQVQQYGTWPAQSPCTVAWIQEPSATAGYGPEVSGVRSSVGNTGTGS